MRDVTGLEAAAGDEDGEDENRGVRAGDLAPVNDAFPDLVVARNVIADREEGMEPFAKGAATDFLVLRGDVENDVGVVVLAGVGIDRGLAVLGGILVCHDRGWILGQGLLSRLFFFGFCFVFARVHEV